MADGDLNDGPLADKEKVRKKGLEERLSRRTELADIAFILGTRSGRRFMWRLVCECGIFKTSMTGNNTTFFNEGMRNIGLKFFADVNEFPDLYLLMVKESREPLEREKENGPRMMEDPKKVLAGSITDD